MLESANHKDGYNGLKRGQFFTTIKDMQDAMSYKIGYRKVAASKDQIRSSYEALTKATMITREKTTRGMIITICNYDYYQNPKNYESHTEPHTENTTKPEWTPHYKQEGERKTRKLFNKSPVKNFPSQEILNEASIKKINSDTDIVCQKLVEAGIFPKAYAFRNAMMKKNKNERAILHALARCYLKKTFKEGPWQYCVKIIQVEDGNYNERDYQKTT